MPIKTVYVNKLLTQIIRPSLLVAPTFEGVRPSYVTKQPANVADVLPIIVGKGVAGSELDPRFGADFASAQFDVYAGGEDAAHHWSQWLRNRLWSAYNPGEVFTDGYISSFETLSTPFEFPDSSMPSDIVRYTSEYRLGVRPP